MVTDFKAFAMLIIEMIVTGNVAVPHRKFILNTPFIVSILAQAIEQKQRENFRDKCAAHLDRAYEKMMTGIYDVLSLLINAKGSLNEKNREGYLSAVFKNSSFRRIRDPNKLIKTGVEFNWQ
jgi:hypothetical protein